MLHTKSQGHWIWVLEMKIFKGFLSNMDVGPSKSCDREHLLGISFPIKEHNKMDFNQSSGF